MNLQKLMLSALLVVSTSLHAQDQIGWGPGSAPGRGGDLNRPGQRDERRDDRRDDRRDQRDPWADRENIQDVELQLNSYYTNQRLDLIRDAYIRSQLQGQQIREVTITASTQFGNGQARLLINGASAEAPQIIGRQMSRYTFRVDAFSNSVGQSLRNLELDMRGNFYVEKVVFSLLQNTGPTWPGPGNPSQPQVDVVRQQVNQSISVEGGLQLSRLFDLQSRQGQALRRVTVQARALRGSAMISLLKNTESSASSQYIYSQSQRITFEVGGLRIGQDINNLRLFVRGDALIEEVSLEFDRGGVIFPGPGPVLESRIDQIVNQRLYETSGVRLIDLMRIDSRQNNRMVESVEITMRGANYGTRLSLCQQVQNQSAMNCGPMQITQPGSQRIILSSVNFARLSEINLSVRMGMIDIDRIVINLR